MPSEIVTNQDLEIGFSLARRFDLVVCLEVTEHLPERCATTFVESLTNQSDLILLSAAIPFQGGHHHVNEQFLDYWVKLFAIHAIRPLDFVRPRIWNDSRVMWWLRLNPLPAGVVQSHLLPGRGCRRQPEGLDLHDCYQPRLFQPQINPVSGSTYAIEIARMVFCCVLRSFVVTSLPQKNAEIAIMRTLQRVAGV